MDLGLLSLTEFRKQSLPISWVNPNKIKIAPNLVQIVVVVLLSPHGINKNYN